MTEKPTHSSPNNDEKNENDLQGSPDSDKKLNDTEPISNQAKLAKRFRCVYCRSEFSFKSNLFAHMKQKHDGKQKDFRCIHQ